jgi:omega-6 fatty acid desaturase (delta-12 desaturase)
MNDLPAQAGQELSQLADKLSKYCQARPGRAVWELSITGALFLVSWLVALIGFAHVHWLFAFLSVPAGVFLVRLFLIQHDCGHGSFFRNRTWNDVVGRTLGVLTWTPYAYWRRLHASHHATSGNLDMRGKGDIDTLTVSEYRGLNRWRRLLYRLYRNPFVLFGLGPAYVFMLKQRMPLELVRDVKDGWISVMTTNAGIIGLIVVATIVAGPSALAAVHLPTTLCAATIGVWLFYVQHQFHGTRWDGHDEWEFHRQAVEGSSFYDLPGPLRWLTANIGIHHVHHLRSRIPSYRLYECLKDIPELRMVNRLTMWESFKCASLALWDDSERKLLSFRALRKMKAAKGD